MLIDPSACTGCGTCLADCPSGAITMAEKAEIGPQCVECGVCARVCPHQAVRHGPPAAPTVECPACPIHCRIPSGYPGACRRYRNDGGQLQRTVKLVVPPRKGLQGGGRGSPLSPLITAIGAGTTRPDSQPAPYIVQERVNQVDVVTVASEAPLSYSSVRVKIDTDLYIGEEGAPVLRDHRVVGMVVTDEYGSKMLSIGGVSRLGGKHGHTVARTIVDISNKQPLELTVKGGARLVVQVGQAPIIDGCRAERMRVGCGSALIGLFAKRLREVADEVVVIDTDITGLLSELEESRSGSHHSFVKLAGDQHYPGAYFLKHGAGWGGTEIAEARDIVATVDREVARPGMTLLVLETTGERAAVFQVNDEYGLDEIPITPEAQELARLMAHSAELSRVSALYVGGAGGSSRAGVTSLPLGLTRAVHSGAARLTVGGAATFIYPGGGITFAVDVEQVPGQAFAWVPTPATVAPLEYTMERRVYEEIGGHVECIRPLQEILAHVEFTFLGDQGDASV